MALLWCDGFDHYGTTPNGGRDAMLAGPWAEIDGSGSPVPRVDATFQRTGPYALRFPASGATPGFYLARRLFGADKSIVGLGFGLYMPDVPVVNGRNGFSLRDNANAAVLTFALQSDASVQVFRGTTAGTSLGRTGQVLTAQAWNHVEIRAHRDAAVGGVEIRVNGVTALDIAGANTGAADFAGVSFGKLDTGAIAWYEMAIDDVFAWDTAGASNNDFIGPQGVHTLFPDQDTVESDWTRNAGATDFEAIDEVPPDGDTTYIEAAAANDVSVFGLADLPSGVSAISAVQLTGMLRKTDAGSAQVQMSLLSSDVGSPPAPAEANGADRPITEVYTYWPDVLESDPATGAPWTPGAVNAARLKIERTV